MAFGAPEDVVDGIAQAHAGDCLIWPENWDALLMFLACETQWRITPPDGKPSGIDYTALQAAMQMAAVTDVKQTFAGVQIMEKEVLRVWSER